MCESAAGNARKHAGGLAAACVAGVRGRAKHLVCVCKCVGVDVGMGVGVV